MKFTSQDKLTSREQTIIKPYRQHFSHTIPKDKQFWALCAECNHHDSEYSQMIREGLVTPQNYHGVDLDQQTIQNNIATCEGNFHYGDIYQVMANHDDFNPAIVNLDFLRTFDSELENIRRVILLLANYENVLLSFNVLVKNFRVETGDPDHIIYKLCNNPDIAMAFRKHGWSTVLNPFLYNGKGHNTLMASVTMIKKS